MQPSLDIDKYEKGISFFLSVFFFLAFKFIESQSVIAWQDQNHLKYILIY